MVDMERLGLVKDDAHNRDKWGSLTTGNRLTQPQCGNSYHIKTFRTFVSNI